MTLLASLLFQNTATTPAFHAMPSNLTQGRHGWQDPKAWALPGFWASIRSYKKQPVKKTWGRVLGLAWLKFAMAAL